MLGNILKQTSWSMIGTIFGFAVGFFVKMYLIRAVGTDAFGKYIIGQTVVTIIQTIIALALPQVLLKFIPMYLEKKENNRANSLASFSTKYLFFSGVFVAFFMMLFAEYITGLFKSSDGQLQYIIFISALYLPLTMYMLAITSLYRTLLKIKEIVIYGTIWLVSIRAVLTFIVFYFSNDISHFIYIELVSILLVLLIMTIKFNFSKLHFFKPFSFSEIRENRELIKFTKKMYFYALIGFFGGYTINLIMSIELSANDVGIYAILMTIAGLSSFLLTSLNQVFAPLISKLHTANELHKLEVIFKDTTFIINIVTAPFIVIMILFSKDILALYGENVSLYVQPFAILVLGQYINLFVGNSGMLLLMGGRENYELYIKIFNIIFILITSIIFMRDYGIIAAVVISSSSVIISNLLQVYFVKRKFGFVPWTFSSVLTLIMSVLVIVYFIYINPKINFEFFDYIWIVLVVLAIFWIPFIGKIKKVILEIKENRS